MLQTAEFSEVRIPVPWGHIAGRWYGDQTLRPILALHGWLDNCGSFARLVPLLLPNAGSILCVDLPGHGHSSHLPLGGNYYNEFVRTITRVMHAYNWSKVSLMGHSMGGHCAFNYAALYPERVDLLIGLDIVKRQYFWPDQEITMIRFYYEKLEVDENRLLHASEMNEPPSYSFEQCVQMLHEGSGHSVNVENCKYLLERNVRRSQKYPEKYYFARDMRMKYHIDLNPSLPLVREMTMRICKSKIPHLVVRGGASTNLSAKVREVEDLCENFNENYKEFTVPGGTHHVHLNEPDKVAKYVNEFLEKYRPLEAIRGEKKIQRNDKRGKL